MEFLMDKKSSRLILFIALLLMQAVVYATDIYRFKDNKVVERWGNNDGVTLLRQPGLLKE
jgi:hypothetical protein